jgi:hypothetical protein
VADVFLLSVDARLGRGPLSDRGVSPVPKYGLENPPKKLFTPGKKN